MEKSIVSAMHGLYAYLSDGAVLGVQRIFESYKSTNSFCESLMYWCWGSMISDAKGILSTGCEAECFLTFRQNSNHHVVSENVKLRRRLHRATWP